MSVDRCICRRVTFKYLLELSKTMGTDAATLAQATGWGDGCGMCIPYGKMALKNGKARVPVMNDAQFANELGPDFGLLRSSEAQGLGDDTPAHADPHSAASVRQP